ncbi:DUF2285 domain-containing protein [Telmatospirillum sp.]|uniref:DUF2285 domain-containing protein n=1 Tax=Telmatospirillum sp. TaxID=2079197 RepID=UPI0028496172|nr:DUF2285 domain-containing protein [Telmatospirillum sp.]MDR3437326.1 DUF2285 domain-containing protein [Telmatospirillum sp.]
MEDDTSALYLIEVPEFITSEGNFGRQLLELDAIEDDDGIHRLFDPSNGQRIHVMQRADLPAGTALAAVVPLDAHGFDRIEAIARLLQGLQGRAAPPDTRLTPQQVRRARRMLQAVDGHRNGATYREIADVVFGAPRVASEPWKTSALRDATMALVKDALTMIAGGYRSLLRHRRRK